MARYNVEAVPFQPQPGPKIGTTVSTSQGPGPGPAGDRARPHRKEKPRKGPNPAHNRSAPRGGNHQQRRHSGVGGRPASEVADAADVADYADLVLHASQGRRGQISITHLVNYEPLHGSEGDSSSTLSKRQTHARRHHVSSGADSSAYINASCQFVVHEHLSLDTQTRLQVDPDQAVAPDLVVRILSKPAACPICLEPVPAAPRMLSCGHVMCLPCLLRFQDDGSDASKPRECPLCAERVRTDRPTAVSFVPVRQDAAPAVGQDVVLHLMVRPHGSLLAVPCTTERLSERMFSGLPLAEREDVRPHARLLRASRAYRAAECARELSELEAAKQEAASLYGEPALYYDRAISSVVEAQAVTMDQVNVGDMAGLDVGAREPSFNDDSAYFFYEAGFETDTRFFLSALDNKILKQAYGSYSAFPPVLAAPVTNVNFDVAVDDELRSRMKQLAHLPRFSRVAFVECDWRGLVPDAVLAPFAPEIQRRVRARRERERREDRDRARYDRQEQEMFRKEMRTEAFSPHQLALQRLHEGVEADTIELGSELAPELAPEFKLDPEVPELAPVPQTTWKPSSFAAVASGEDQFDRLLAQAQTKRKGRKKLVLLTNAQRHS